VKSARKRGEHLEPYRKGRMKKTRRCPKCDSIDLLYIAEPFANRRDDHAQTTTTRLALVREPGDTVGAGEAATGGLLEAYCCAAWGYAETYVKNWRGIEVDGKFVVRLAPPDGSYR